MASGRKSDIQQILRARTNRRGRLAIPINNFRESINQCIVGGETVLGGSVDVNVRALVERAAVISTVTAVEVYFRYILELIFPTVRLRSSSRT